MCLKCVSLSSERQQQVIIWYNTGDTNRHVTRVSFVSLSRYGNQSRIRCFQFVFFVSHKYISIYKNMLIIYFATSSN